MPCSRGACPIDVYELKFPRWRCDDRKQLRLFHTSPRPLDIRIPPQVLLVEAAEEGEERLLPQCRMEQPTVDCSKHTRLYIATHCCCVSAPTEREDNCAGLARD